MRIDVLTIFPELVTTYAEGSVLGRAQGRGVLELHVHDLRRFALDDRGSVDDTPFGGGAGMVLAPGPVFDAVEALERESGDCHPIYALSAAGRPFDAAMARTLAGLPRVTLVCGRYEGIDQRVLDHLCDDELSVGDVVLAGGELAALVVVEATTRLLPGALGNEASSGEESFEDGLLEYPQYTRPAEFRGHAVPEVLRSGDHARVARWRRAEALRRTIERRPDLLARRGGLSEEDRAVLSEFDVPAQPVPPSGSGV